MRRRPQDNLLLHLFKKMEIGANNCWLWIGNKFPNGYGKVKINGKSRQIHRLIWELCNSPIPTGLYVCHYCDIHSCANPEHLFLGTQKDNLQDAVRKGRMSRGSSRFFAKLTEDSVIKIRSDSRPQKEIAEDYGISVPNVSRIKSRKSWIWL